MRIALEKFNISPLQVRQDTPASDWRLDRDDIKFVDSVQVCATFVKTAAGIEVLALITTHKDIICGRCLLCVRQTATQEFKKNYALAELGDYLDIDNDIREEILLNFPMKVLCRPDCRGLCSECGANLNNEPCRCMGQQ